MVLMKYFCFCIPVRLGIIITSIITIIENGVVLIIIFMYSAEDIANFAEDFRDKSKDNSYDTSSKEVYEVFIEYAKEYSVELRYTCIGTFAGCIAACFLNIYASLSKNRLLSLPFILIRLFEIVVIFVLHVNCMLYLKKNWNLGILIAACCTGGFFILYLLYCWGSTVSFFQIIGIVNSKRYKDLMEQNKQSKKILRKPKNQGVSTIAPRFDEYNGPKMVASDFYGIQKKIIRRI